MISGSLTKWWMVSLLILNYTSTLLGLSCYHCVSNQPGCGTPLDWRWQWSRTCEEDNDKCVKIIERKGVDEIITRSCLSGLEYQRHDIPADKYEGCRPASYDVKLAHYVNNSIKELDIKRNYYDEVTWCFCEFDHFCNLAAIKFNTSNFMILCCSLVFFLYKFTMK